MKTEAQLLPPSAVKEEEIDPLEGQEELGIFQVVDHLEEITESLLTRWIISYKVLLDFKNLPLNILGTKLQLTHQID